jgi:hypothetical protein
MEKLDSGVADVHRRARRLTDVPRFSDTLNPLVPNASEAIRRTCQIDKREAKNAVNMLEKWPLMREKEFGTYAFTLETALATPEIGGHS